ncbi:MAG: PepSY domain-containing protein [Candidatus Wenzhouxiangella sp. M2_3B_020]
MSSRSAKPSSIAAIFRSIALALVLVFALPVPEAIADSLREVAERIAREHDAKVVSARVVERNGRRFYVIRILTRDGVIRTFTVPAGDRR